MRLSSMPWRLGGLVVVGGRPDRGAGLGVVQELLERDGEEEGEREDDDAVVADAPAEEVGSRERAPARVAAEAAEAQMNRLCITMERPSDTISAPIGSWLNSATTQWRGAGRGSGCMVKAAAKQRP